jgi:hypothetical protein
LFVRAKGEEADGRFLRRRRWPRGSPASPAIRRRNCSPGRCANFSVKGERLPSSLRKRFSLKTITTANASGSAMAVTITTTMMSIFISYCSFRAVEYQTT